MTHARQPATEQLAARIVALAKSLFDRGFCVGSAGNISVRIDGGFLMTPTNSSLGRLESDHLSLLDEQWNHIDGSAPSKEIPMHRAYHSARPDTGALVHLHSTHVVAMSLVHHAGEPFLPVLTPYQVMRTGGHIPVIGYFRPGSAEVVDEIAAAAADHKVLVLAHHGCLVGGRDLEDAVNAAEELEESARLAWLTRASEPNLLTDSQIRELLG